MVRVLSIGECMAELAPASTPGTYSLGFAGDTFNTAWYLAQLCSNADVSYFTAVGEDAISGQMLDMIGKSGIGTEHVQVIPGRSVGLYLITLNAGERSFSYWRGQSAARCLARDAAALRAAHSGSDIVYFSGITLGILDLQDRATLLDEIGAARRDGKQVVFDPNLRPRLWDSPSDMTEAVMQAAAVSTMILPSFEDETSWFGDADPAATLARYCQAGADTVIVKNGAGDVHYHDFNAQGIIQVAPLSDVVDTTAAGDSFNAALLAGQMAGWSRPFSIDAASRLARHVIQGKGALVHIDQSLIDRFA
jgi:2-dehydro-3-deoxygluconokinase